MVRRRVLPVLLACALVSAVTPIPGQARASQSRANPRLTVPPRTAALLAPMLGGLNADVAAQGFRSLQEFVTVLHVAENLEIPFVTLKKRVVTDRVALPQAVRAMRPGVDVKLELGKADKQARTTLATR